MGRKIYVESYGCSLQKGEAGLYVNGIMENGDVIVQSPEDADIRVIGTCAVIRKTENHMLERIGSLSETGPTRVIGCLPPVSMNTINMKNVEMMSPLEFRDLYKGGFDDVEIHDPSILDGIPINQGCTGSCNYCISRVARGKLLSRNADKICGQVKMQVERGIREVRISSLDTSAYGKDTGVRLPQLVDKICSIPMEFKLRVGMMEPKNTSEILGGLMASYENSHVFKFLHLPVQSGDDRILEAMNREYGISQYFDIVERFRGQFPDSVLSTDIISGYPDDDEESFEKTMRMLEKSSPDIINITRFSPRQYTKDFPRNPPPSNLVKRWTQEYSRLHHEILENRLDMQLGKVKKVMVTEHGKNNSSVCRDEAYRPVVVPGSVELYSSHDVEIVEASGTYLIGKIVG